MSGKRVLAAAQRATSPASPTSPSSPTSSASPASPTKPKDPAPGAVAVGQRVVIAGDSSLRGTVRFSGKVHFTDSPLVGVELDQPSGTSDGRFDGRVYFQCQPHHGIFVRPDLVLPEGATAAAPKPVLPDPATSRKDVLRRELVEAVDERDHGRILHHLLPEAVTLGLDAGELASAARLAMAATRKEAQAGGPSAGSFDLVLMQRYTAVQDAVSQLAASMASLRAVISNGSPPTASSLGEPAKYIAPGESDMQGDWKYNSKGTRGHFTVSKQVGERGEELLCYEEVMTDGRRLSSWLSRRDGEWLVGDLYNSSSKELLGLLRLKAERDANLIKVTSSFRAIGANEWGPEVVALAGALSTKRVRIEGGDIAEDEKNADRRRNMTLLYDGSGSEDENAQGGAGAPKAAITRLASLISDDRFTEDSTPRSTNADARLNGILEAIRDVKRSLAEARPAGGDIDFGPVIKEIHGATAQLLESQVGAAQAAPSHELAELREAVRDVQEKVCRGTERSKSVPSMGSSAEVDFTPLYLELHKYMTLIQDTVKNGANLSPVLDALRKNQKLLLKKLEEQRPALLT